MYLQCLCQCCQKGNFYLHLHFLPANFKQAQGGATTGKIKLQYLLYPPPPQILLWMEVNPPLPFPCVRPCRLFICLDLFQTTQRMPKLSKGLYIFKEIERERKGREKRGKSLLSLYNINIQEIVQRVRLVQILLLIRFENKQAFWFIYSFVN